MEHNTKTKTNVRNTDQKKSGRGSSNSNQYQTDSENVETVIQVKRVSKKTKGGNNIGFSVLTVVGDRKGQVGIGVGKGPDVASSIRKAIAFAKKHQITVPLYGTTIPHKIFHKYGASRVMIKPARPGTGLIAGGAIRAVLAAAGVKDGVAKMLGSSNPTTNVYGVFEALQNFKIRESKEKEIKKESSKD